MRVAAPRLRESGLVPAALLGALVAVAVTAPWWGDQPVFLLDWVLGPHTPVVPRQAYGLDGGVTAALPLLMAAPLMERLIGTAATWLPVALAFPLASVGTARLLRHLGAGRSGMLAASLIYAINPWVLDRIAVGHIALLLGYALLPFFVLVLLRDLGGSWRSAVSAGLLFAVLVGVSIHWFWLAGLVLLVATVGLGRGARGWLWSGAALLVAVPCSAYLLIGPLAAQSSRPLPDEHDLAAYQSSGTSLATLTSHLVSLQGFWRPLPQEPVYLLPAWPLLWAALLLVVVRGYAGLLRGTSARAARVLGVVALMGLLLAFGARGPTGWLFRIAFDQIPGFRVMREPQKFESLVALGYAVGFGLGAEHLLRGLRAHTRAAGACLLAGLVCAVSFSLFWGVNGSIKPSDVPTSLAEADRLMGDRDAGVLVLPWHLYLAFPWTQGRVIANPAAALLDRLVVAGDIAELPGVPEEQETARSAAVRRILAAGQSAPVVEELQALQVRYVLLLHGADWSTYGWLAHQPGLTPVATGPDLDLWEVPDVPGCDVNHAATARYDVRCTGSDLVLPEPYDPGWHLDGVAARSTSAGLSSFTLTSTQRDRQVTVRYSGEAPSHALLWFSGGSAILLVTILQIPSVTGRVARSRSNITSLG